MTRRTGWIAAFGLAVALLGCKQGEGEYCQIDDDCKDGLICNTSINECRPRSQDTTPDAGLAPDAEPEPDAAEAADAAPDAEPAPDAMPDAA